MVNEPQKMYAEYTVVIVLFISFTVSYMVLRFICGYTGNQRYPKGPWGFPLIGNLPFFGKYPPSVFHHWRQDHGDIYSIRMGSWNTVVINGYDNIQEASLHCDDFSGRPGFVTQNILRERDNGADSLAFGPFSDVYMLHRKTTSRALRMVMMSHGPAVEEMIATEASNLAECLIEKNEKNGSDGVFIELDIQYRIGSIIYQLLYGLGQNLKEDHFFNDIVKALKEFMEFNRNGNPVDVMPWLRWFCRNKMNQFVDLAKVALRIRDIKVKEHLNTYSSERGIRDITDALIAIDLQNEEINRRFGLSRHHILCTVSDLFGAGFETINTMILWMVLYMISYPDVQARVRKEINCNICTNARVTWQDRRRLPYTDATVHEILRITSILPFSMPHFTTRDTKLNGYEIDKNTVALFNLHSVHFDVNYWNDPEKFRPERLLDENGCLDKNKCRRILAFGVGRRRCVGERIAMMELFIVFTTLVRKCMFRAVEIPDLEPVSGMVYKPKPFRVNITGGTAANFE